MKKFLKKLLLFLVITSCFYTLLIGFWGYYVPAPLRRNLIYNPQEGYLDKKLSEIEKFKNVDVVFLGSSHAYRGFDTRIFKNHDISSFNLGSSAQTHIQTKYLLNTYLKNLRPKLVIYEVYPEMFTIDGVESTINIVSATDNINSGILKLLFQTKDIRSLNTALFSLFEPSDSIVINPVFSEEDLYVSGGFVEKKLNYNSEAAVRKEWKPLKKQLAAFKENINFLKSHNIPYLLVQAPYTFEYSNYNRIEKFLSEDGIYYNFNDIVDLSANRDFYDDSHLNQIGVEKFNRELIRIIDSLELLKE
ncbi:hypothetical protein SAMN05444483_103207 [Salegentibacter echinorum]|uniref:Uncharacterized protein n=1 Tax=Salegentibacter echinorum TaxID=1073325 RepID=A0A1M5FIR0_SALEC|nr:hypothetical protein [Salegentibacter echinorum]SHF91299.1 hypothetical protein SAMN05444483_103207 [Salegentibacter echinorum]